MMHSSRTLDLPTMMPVLSRGRHRNPRKGACFMEMASYLAGERWSDHPDCTHPLLAEMARDVNDLLGDDLRTRMVPLISDVVGLRTDDRRAHLWIAREAAIAAITIAPERHQRVAAVTLLVGERLRDEVDDHGTLEERVRVQEALDHAPLARRWAESMLTRSTPTARAFIRYGGSAAVRSATSGIASAAVPDPQARLVDLLEQTVAMCQDRFGHQDRQQDRQPAQAASAWSVGSSTGSRLPSHA